MRRVRRRGKSLRSNVLREGSFSYEILRYAVAGTLLVGLVGVLAVAPGLARAGKLFRKPSSREQQRRHKARVREAMRRLEKRRLVRLVPREDGIAIEVTRLGKEVFERSVRESIRPPIQKRWDGRWHVVMFDIPEQKKDARDALRRKLRDVGFYALQKSVFATPYPCRKEVETIASFYGAQHFVTYLETDHLGRQEKEARAYFGV